jgi:hypothetical protein
MKNKRGLSIIVLTILFILSTTLIAANPWPARLTLINQTGDNLYLWLFADNEKTILDYYFVVDGDPLPRPIPKGFNFALYRKENTVTFHLERKVYTAWILGCGVMMEGKMDVTKGNLQLNITPCSDMIRFDKPRYLGEPTLEKPNWFREPNMLNWRFKYILPSAQDMAGFIEFPEPAGDNME